MAVDAVSPEGPADMAGMKGGDRIIRIGDKKIANVYDYMAGTRNNKAGDLVEVAVLRDGTEHVLKVALARRNSPGARWSLSNLVRLARWDWSGRSVAENRAPGAGRGGRREASPGKVKHVWRRSGLIKATRAQSLTVPRPVPIPPPRTDDARFKCSRLCFTHLPGRPIVSLNVGCAARSAA